MPLVIIHHMVFIPAQPANILECLEPPANILECLEPPANILECLEPPANILECLEPPVIIPVYLALFQVLPDQLTIQVYNLTLFFYNF